jgi:serine palmitoyltransferase
MKVKAKSREDPDLPWYHVVLIYLGYALMIFFGYFEDTYDKITGKLDSKCQAKKDYPPLLASKDSFYTRRLYSRFKDCWNRPISSCPGPWITVQERVTNDFNETFKLTGKEMKCLNLGSYNYLGFSDCKGKVLEEAQAVIKKYGISTCSDVNGSGTNTLLRQVEKKTAQFLGQEDCIVYGMGYNTNASSLASIVGKGCLIISDSLNHASLVTGCRTSEAKIKVFPHNDTEALEKIIRSSIAEGQPRTHKPWRKILIIVEGIYSMEGETCQLPEVVRIKNKYKCYLWIDEAHSIGALGKTGRGVCEYWGINHKEVDLLMGTFTKSFASVGGYITGKKELIAHIRKYSFCQYDASISPGCCQQILCTMGIIGGEDGTNEGQLRIKNLRDNSNFVRTQLIERGFKILGDQDSPIIPIMVYNSAKLVAFSRECLKRNIAVVIVGYPATPLLMSRVRLCISASHVKEDLEWALNEMDELGAKFLFKYEIE